MFKGFDFGKGLLRQVDGFRRLNPQQQKRKEAGLLKALNTYTKRYMAVVDKPSGANPGLLTNGAEALVETSLALKNGSVAYPAFAELVARSKKVAVVPGLQKLVDRLIELPTHLKNERVALLGWRITKGSLAPERALQYLAERAQLTGDPDDWKDYAYELLQLVKKDTLQLNQDLTIEALKELLGNKHKLGDDLINIQLMMAESYLVRKEDLQAETLLIDIASEPERLTPAFTDTAEKLLKTRPTAEWGLHSMVLAPLLDKFAEGQLGWNQLEDKLKRAQGHGESMVEFLLSHEHLPADERLSLYTLKQVLKMDQPDRFGQLVARWNQRHEEAGTPRPVEARQLLNQAVLQGKLDEVPESITAPQSGTATLTACTSAAELDEQLSQLYEEDVPAGAAPALLCDLAAGDQPDWLIAATRRWFAARLLAQADYEPLSSLLDAVPVTDADEAGALLEQIRTGLSDELAPEAATILAGLELARGDYLAALDLAEVLPEADGRRSDLLTALETAIVSQAEPTPALLMVLARTQRLASEDPEAGFEPATTASLLASGDETIERSYGAWLDTLEPRVVHHRRAQQATYLTTREGHCQLLPLAVREIEELAQAAGSELPAEPLQWLGELRPLLDTMAEDDQEQLRIEWTRLYLMFATRPGNEEQIPAAIHTAAQEVEPLVALSLAEELGVPVPAGARLVVECETLAKQGEWQRAVEMMAELEPSDAQALLPVQLLCGQLPPSSLLAAAEQMHGVLAARSPADELELVRCLDARLADEPATADTARVREFADHALQQLCDSGSEPAAKYLLASGRQFGEPAEHLRHLLTLTRAGDEEALSLLQTVLPQLLPDGAPAEALREAAEVLAESLHDEQPGVALEALARTALATSAARWGLDCIDSLGLAAETAAHTELLGQLALQAGDQERALDAVKDLSDQDAQDESAALAKQVAASADDSETVHRELIGLQLAGADPDFTLATKHLLKLVQKYQDRDAEMHEMVSQLAGEVADALEAAGDRADVQHFKLILAALRGQGDEVRELIENILAQGPDAAASLLELFDSLALEDGGLPTVLVVTWGRLLFMAGRTEDALDRIAGLHDTVRDYPEFAPLLAEIRDSGGGPGASMQLGQAYIRVNLWQESAEEYAAALALDPDLAVPILTQLRHHGALAPNPMQYPLHLLALRCVSQSERPADWGWALSALTWLLPRWSAEELYGLAAELWANAERGELSADQRGELALDLHQLAVKLGKVEEALEFLGEAWQLAEEPGSELLDALAAFDASLLPTGSKKWQQLHGLQLSAAVLRDDVDGALTAARLLAEAGPSERQQALSVLTDFQGITDKPAPVLLGRLQLLDLNVAEDRQTFIQDLLTFQEADLPPAEVHQLIRKALELTSDSADSTSLTKLLLQLFGQLGDQARAWQLALNYFHGDDEVAQLAQNVLAQLAGDEFAVNQRVAMIEIQLLRGDHDGAAAALGALDTDGLGEPGVAASALAEALLSTPAAATARQWLVDYLRDTGDLALAADHLVWAHATSNPLPAGWLEEQSGGDLRFRAGQLKELHGDTPTACRLYAAAAEDKDADRQIRAAAGIRLSELLEEAGELHEAHQRVSDVLEIMPSYVAVEQRLENLTAGLLEDRIKQLRSDPDSVDRTIEVAQLFCAVGEPVKAIGELQAGIDRGQASPLLSAELGECFLLTGDHRIALRAFEEVPRRLGDDTEHNELRLRALYGMATAYEQLGDRDAAVRSLEQILVLKHNYRDSRQRLQALYAGTDQPPPQPAKPAEGQQEILGEILSMLGVPDDAGDDEDL